MRNAPSHSISVKKVSLFGIDVHILLWASSVIPVKKVVLNDENHVKEDGHVAQSKFDGIPSNAAPVCLHQTVYELLCNTQYAASDIQ